MADPSGSSAGPEAGNRDPAATSPALLGLLVVAVLLARVVVWMQSDLWYDEVVTLVEFAMGGEEGGIAHVFRHYPIANNHVLFSALSWIWLRLVGYSLVEPVLRLPSLVFGVLAVLAVLRFWRRSLGRRVAVFAALLLAASPVLSPQFYQFRGYSLSLLLAALVTAGAHELAQGDLRRGAWLCVLPCLLLPLVVPSNLLLVGALSLFVLVAGRGGWLARIRAAAVLAMPGLLGMCYYLTIWDQFLRVTRQTAGWSSGWLVGGHLLLALVAHLGPLCLFVPGSLLSRSQLVGQARRERRDALLLAGACALAVVAGILSSRTAPFPRVFAVLFVPLGWAAFRLCRQAAFWQSRSPLLAAGAILFSAFAWERGADLLTQRQVARGERPQNLLQQYYRGDSGLSEVVMELRRREWGDGVLVITDAFDFPTFNFYWRVRGLPTEETGQPYVPGMARVVAVNDDRRVEICRTALQRGLRLLALAHTEEGAARLFGDCGQTGKIEPVLAAGARTLHALTPGVSRPPAVARPSGPGLR